MHVSSQSQNKPLTVAKRIPHHQKNLLLCPFQMQQRMRLFPTSRCRRPGTRNALRVTFLTLTKDVLTVEWVAARPFSQIISSVLVTSPIKWANCSALGPASVGHAAPGLGFICWCYFVLSWMILIHSGGLESC